MDYTPWPAGGCTLSEARERTADRLAWAEWHRADGKRTAGRQSGLRASAGRRNLLRGKPVGTIDAAISDAESSINTGFRLYIADGHLVAYGRPAQDGATLRRISTGLWPRLTTIDWDSSSVSDGTPDGLVFLDVRVFPVLLAPDRAVLLDGCPLSEAFTRYVLQDPEVAALAKPALRKAPEFARVFIHGHCYVHGVSDWPVAGREVVGTVHPDPEKRWLFGPSRKPDPIEVVIAADALSHRYVELTGLLRRGELEARGLPDDPGHASAVLRSIWSHPDFSFDARTGDVYGLNPKCQDPPDDRLNRIWIGVVLQQSQAHRAGRELPISDAVSPPVFHVKPTEPHGILAATLEPQPAPKRSTKGARRVETTGKSLKACRAWLEDLMRASLDRRAETISSLWAQAEANWPGTLSKRSFLAARAEAVRATGATIWSAGGAPPKSQQKSPR